MKNFKYGKLTAVLALMLCLVCLVFASCGKKGECKHENVTEKVTDASCEATGKKETVCSDCNTIVKTEEIAAKGHSWSADAEGSKAATCEAEGVNAFKCASCAKTKTEPTAKVSHNYLPDAALSKEATCTEGGKEVTKCSYCGNTDTIETTATGHDITTEWIYTGVETPKPGAKCVYLCERTAECASCGTVKESDEKTIHNYEFGVKTEATCSKPGEKAYVCTDCGTPQGDTSVSYTVDHSWNSGVKNGEYKLYSCTKCDATRKEFDGTQATVKSEDLDSEIKLGDTVISMDSAASDKLGGSNATLSADGLKKDEIPAGMPGLDKVGADDTVYNLMLTKSNGTPITDFGMGKVTVKLPYTLKDGEDPASVTIFYLDPTDGVVIVDGAVYHDGYVTFETNHFSYYMVGRYTVKEICEKYGHNWFVSERAASCTESGFNLTVCTRCREKDADHAPVIPALGHVKGEPTDEKAVGCTENGYKKYNCSRCTKDYTEVIYAEGHEWSVTENVASSCTVAGYTKETCAKCSEEKFEYGKLLPHDYKAETVNATCTEGGYTQRTCNVCGYTERSNETAALGHKWDIEAPTCGAGQKCTVCGANGAAATGNHNMVNGVCSVCGSGCEHDYKLTEEKTANCTESGYKKYTCSKCQSEKTEDFVAALGHNTDGEGGRCSVCGEGGGSVDTAFVENLLNSIASGDRTITVSDVTIYAKNKYTVDNRVEIFTVIKIDFSQAVIAVKDGVGKIYGKADVRVSNDGGSFFETLSAEIYGDGTYLYAKTVSEKDNYIYRYSYDYLTGETDSNAGSISGMLTSVLMGTLNGTLMDDYNNMSASEKDTFCKLVDIAFKEIFVDKGNNVYALNTAELKNISASLENDTVDAFIDKYFGDGSYATLKDELLAAGAKTIEEFYTELVEYAEANGVTEESVVSSVEELLTYAFGGEVDLKEMLKDEQFAGMTLEDILKEISSSMGGSGEQDTPVQTEPGLPGVEVPVERPVGMSTEESEFDYVEQMTAMFEMLEQSSLYDILFAGDEFVEVIIKKLVDSLANESMFSLTLTTDASGAVKSIAVKLNSFEATVGGSYGAVSPGEELPDEFTILNILNVTGELKVEMKASMPSAAEALKNEYEQTATKVWNSIKNNCGSGSFTVICRNYDTGAVFTKNSDGTLGVKIYATKYFSGNNYVPNFDSVCLDIPDVSKYGAIEFNTDCSGAYYVYISGTVYDSEGYTTWRSISFYVNTVNSNVTGTTQHNFQPYTPTDLPAGTPTSPDMVDCEKYWYTYEKCTLCGEVVRHSEYKSHENEYSYKLPAGFTNCEYDEYTVIISCALCGEYINEYNTTGHWSEAFETEYVYDTPHGTMTVTHTKCPCGYQDDFDFYNYDEENGCAIGWDTTDYEAIMSGGEQIGYKETYHCAIGYEGIDGPQSQCTFYMIHECYYPTESETSCLKTYRNVYTFYNNGVKVGESVTTYDKYYNHNYDNNVIIDTSTHHKEERSCRYCDAATTYEARYDSIGRTIFEYCKDYENGRVVSEYHYRYEYESLSSCFCHSYYRDYLTMSEEYSNGEYDKHQYTYYAVIPGTCTQAPLYYEGCKLCGYDGVYSYREPDGHYWYWDWETQTYVCYKCGLESVTANSYISMEDLTNDSIYGNVSGKYVIGFYDYTGEPLSAYFTFVKNDGSGESIIADVFDWSFESFEYNGEYYHTPSMLCVSMEDVVRAAEDAGISLDNYDLGITLHHETASPEQQELFCTFVLTDLVY